MSSNPDDLYRERAASEPVAPVTLWLYPKLRLVKGSMQRSVLADAKLKASMPWLSRLLMFGFVSGQALLLWARETGRYDLRKDAEGILLVVLLSILALVVVRYLRTRALLRPDESAAVSARVDG